MRRSASSPRSNPPPPARRGVPPLVWVVAVVTGALLLGAAVRFGLFQGGQTRPAVTGLVAAGTNVLLISIDTIRADHLPAYGYVGFETPAISQLAREGVLLRTASTPVPLTLPAHVSLLTGLAPFSHGVRDNAGFRLDDRVRTLAEIFKEHGYRTGAFVSAFVLDSRWGLAQGFDEYFDDFPVAVTDLAAMGGIQRPGAETWEAARRWLRSAATGAFFLWLHLFEPHTPYEPPEPFKTRHASAPYDGEIAYADSLVGQALAELERDGRLERTVVVLVGDHGEGLGDHGEDEHGLLVYDSTLRVPWIMRLPSRHFAGVTIDRPVSLVDVMPTLLELLGFPPEAPLDGESAVPAIAGRADAGPDVQYAETHYPRIHFGWSALTAVRHREFKYIRAPKPELYAYVTDPAESRNVIDQHPEVAARLDRIADRLASQTPTAARPMAVDPDTRRRLRALGYVGGGAASQPDGDGLADPKDKAAVFRKLMRSREALETGRVAEGVRGLTELLVEEPALEQAHRALRDHWIARGDYFTAISTFQAALARDPGQPQLLLDLAIVHRAARQPEAALAKLASIFEASPDRAAALTLAGEILSDLGRHQEALDRFTRARAKAPGPDSTVKVAQANFHLGRLDEAEALLTQVLAEEPDTNGGHYLLGQIAEQRGDLPRAESEYRQEIDAHPWDYQARFNLAMLLARRGAFAEEAALLDSIPPLAPAFHDVHFYRAKAYLDQGDPSRWGDAIAAARAGLRLAPESSSAPLGHYVLADIYRLQGRMEEAARELSRGRALEARLANKPG